MEDILKWLKTAESVQEKLDVFFDKLEIFFSYFVSPVFAVQSRTQTEDSVCFDVGFDSDKYPAVTYYFKAVLEAVPLFLGGELTDVKWRGDCLEIFYPGEESLPLPFVPSAVPSSGKEDSLSEKLLSCEKNLLALQKVASSPLLDQALKDLRSLKRELKKTKGGR